MPTVDELVAVLRYDTQGEGQLRRFNKSLAATERRAHSTAGGFRALGAASAALFGIGAGAALAKGASQAITFEQAWDRANKTLGHSPEELERLKDGMRELASAMPTERLSMVEMFAEAGRQGIEGIENQLAFAEATIIAAEAFDVAAPRMAQYFGQIAEQSQKSVDELELFADKINWLGNNTAASEAKIVEFSSRVFSIARDAGIGEDAMLSLGTAMIASGRRADQAATAMIALQREVLGGSLNTSDRQLEAFSRVIAKSNLAEDILDPNNQANMDALAERFAHDFEGTLQAIVEGVGKFSAGERESLVTAMFGEEAKRGFGSLLSDIDRLRAALDRMEDIRGDDVAGGMRREYSELVDNVLSRLQRLRNVIGSIAEQAGEPFLEGLNAQLETLITNLERFRTGEGDAAETFAAMRREFAALSEAAESFEQSLSDLAGAVGVDVVDLDGFGAVGRFLEGRIERVNNILNNPVGSFFNMLADRAEMAREAIEGVTAALNAVADAIQVVREAIATGSFEGIATGIGDALQEVSPNSMPAQRFNEAVEDFYRQAPAPVAQPFEMPERREDEGDLSGAAAQMTEAAADFRDALQAAEAARIGERVLQARDAGAPAAQQMSGAEVEPKVVNDNRQDNSDRSVTANSTVNMNVTTMQQAAPAAAQAVGSAVGRAVGQSAINEASRTQTEPATP